jgi:hypothetical protein
MPRYTHADKRARLFKKTRRLLLRRAHLFDR